MRRRRDLNWAMAVSIVAGVVTLCILAVLFSLRQTAGASANAIANVVKAFAGESKNSFTVYVSSVSGEYALKVATTHGTIRADQEYSRLWAYSKVAVTVPYEAAWTLSLDRNQWHAERRGNTLIVHCPPPVPDKPYLDMDKLRWETPEASSLIISETAMWKDAQAKLLHEAPELVSRQERNVTAVQQKAEDAVKRLAKDWLAKEFPEAANVPIEVEFGQLPKKEGK